jgi:hypothetical protein
MKTKRPKFPLGGRVTDVYGFTGHIDAIYKNLQAAIDAAAVSKDWLGMQERKPKTPRSGTWYSVVSPKGGVLVGEKDAIQRISKYTRYKKTR